MDTNVYIDGFNLYYGSLKGHPRLKWLNLAEMCHRLLPDREIKRVRYFTALVTPRPHNPDELYRQSVYLRALRTIPNLTIHLGRFVTRPARLPRDPLTYLPGQDGPERLAVLKTEEKRTDVNLATYLLVDCFDDDFDEAVIVSNDSDLTLPVEVAVGKFGKPVGMVNPHPISRLSSELREATTFQIRSINRSVLPTASSPKSSPTTEASSTARPDGVRRVDAIAAARAISECGGRFSSAPRIRNPPAVSPRPRDGLDASQVRSMPPPPGWAGIRPRAKPRLARVAPI